MTAKPFCNGVTRRDFIHLGTASLFGLGLNVPTLLRAQHAWLTRVVRAWYDGLKPALVRGWTPMGPGWLWRREVIACVVITRGGSPKRQPTG